MLADGRTLIAGGRLADGTATDSVVIFDPISGSTTSAGQLLIPRVGAAAAMLDDGSVVIIGGMMGDIFTADVELLNLATGTSTLLGVMAEPRADHAAARLANGTVLIVGGATVGGAALATAEIFDPVTQGVMPAGSLTTPRIGASATTLIDGRVLIAGGRAGTSDLVTAEIYDPLAPAAFTLVPTQMSAGRAGHTAVRLPHNAGVLIAGGTSSGSPVASSDLFLPAIFPDPFWYGVGEFASTGAMNAPRAYAVGGPAGDAGYAFVTGGGNAEKELYRYATIKTDKDDYAPGERAVITGSGWQPNEEVRLVFQEDPAVHDDYELTVVANGAGDIYWDQWAPERHDLNVRFYLVAADSRSRAQTTFTDGLKVRVKRQNPTSAGLSLASGAMTSVTFVIENINNNPDQNTAITVSYALTASPGLSISGDNQSATITLANNASFQELTYNITAPVGPATGLTVTLAANIGTSPCPANSPHQCSDFATYTIDVAAPLNSPPVITQSDPVTVNLTEDGSPTPFSLTLNATDANGDTLTWSISGAADHGTASASGTGTSKMIGYSPALNYNGHDDFVVQVSDGNGGTDTITVNVEIAAVNDQPNFTANNPPAVNEDDGPQTVAWAQFQAGGGTDEVGQTPTYIVTNVSNPGLFSGVGPVVSAAGTLTYTPVPNASGTSTFDVMVQDNGGTANGGIDTSAPQSFTITVNAVNDKPSFTASNQTVNEDAGAQSIASWALFNPGAANESGQTATYTVSGVSNPGLFLATPAVATDGTLTFTTASNATGSSTFNVSVQDSGGTANGGDDTSATQTFTITVNAVNDAPSFTANHPPTVNEDAPAQTITGWVTSFNPGGGTDEAGQAALAYTVSGVTNPGLFATGPAVSSIGTLTYTLAPNANGTATFKVKAQDDGGTANGGVDTSAEQEFTLVINAVNDEPSFTAVNPPAVNEDAGAQAVSSWATFDSGGGTDEDTQTATYTVSGVSDPGLFLVAPAVASNGTLTYTPAANAFGFSTFQVTVQDSGGTANSGDDTSATLTFTITVNPVNDAPGNLSFSAATASIFEGASTSLSGSFTDVEATDAHTVTINWGDGQTTTINLAAGVLSIPATAHTYVDDNPTDTASDSYTITVTVADNGTPKPESASMTTSVTVNNVTPTLAITSLVDGALYPVGASVSLTGPITDPGADTFTCKINWDDPLYPGLETFTQTAKNCNKAHPFMQPGVYTIVVTVNDDDQPGVTDTKSVMVIVYDPSAGFVTGGGTIWSPLGAYLPNPALEGKANFGFVSKYQKGAKTPSGQTEFQFHAGGLNFHGDVYQWLVVSGAKAQYKGTGTLNGVPGHGFLLTATDGQLSGGGGVDKFRIKITTSGGVVVYDNNPGPDDIDTSGQQNIQTGSIVIHTK